MGTTARHNMLEPCTLTKLNRDVKNCFGKNFLDATHGQLSHASHRNKHLRGWQKRLLEQMTNMESWFVDGSISEIKSGGKCVTSCVDAKSDNQDTSEIEVHCMSGIWKYMPDPQSLC